MFNYWDNMFLLKVHSKLEDKANKLKSTSFALIIPINAIQKNLIKH